jgi:hypothetical protein
VSRAVARDSALPANTRTAQAIPPAQASAASVDCSCSARAMRLRSALVNTMSASAAPAIRKHATISFTRWPLFA